MTKEMTAMAPLIPDQVSHYRGRWGRSGIVHRAYLVNDFFIAGYIKKIAH